MGALCYQIIFLLSIFLWLAFAIYSLSKLHNWHKKFGLNLLLVCLSIFHSTVYFSPLLYNFHMWLASCVQLVGFFLLGLRNDALCSYNLFLKGLRANPIYDIFQSFFTDVTIASQITFSDLHLFETGQSFLSLQLINNY